MKRYLVGNVDGDCRSVPDDHRLSGKTVEQAAAEYKVPAKYKGYVVTIDPQLVTAAGILQIAYEEMKK